MENTQSHIHHTSNKIPHNQREQFRNCTVAYEYNVYYFFFFLHSSITYVAHIFRILRNIIIYLTMVLQRNEIFHVCIAREDIKTAIRVRICEVNVPSVFRTDAEHI